MATTFTSGDISGSTTLATTDHLYNTHVNELRTAVNAVEAKTDNVTADELSYVDATSSIQTQLDAKSPIASPTFTGTVTIPTPFTIGAVSMTSTAAELNVLDGIPGTLTATELGYLDGVTSAIQTQLDAKTAKATLTTKGDVYAATAASTPARLAVGTDGQVLTADSAQSTGLKWASAGVAFWSDVPGTPTRTSDTQFTITDTGNANSYDKLFGKGVILKWDESGTFQTAMVISSSYGADVVTVEIGGNSLTAGFTSMKYAIPDVLTETFLIPGNQATGTHVSKAFYPKEDIYALAIDVIVETAGTTNSTDYDVNSGGTSIITTKPSIASASTGDFNNVVDNPSTAIGGGSKITVDIDAASTTQAQDGYLKLYYYPVKWRYRT